MPNGKPNILVIWGDDIGITNVSAYSDGLMGYRTPNIDRVANEGMRFTDSYAEQSCTAGRAAFLTGQSVFRTGLSKVGLPGCRDRPASRGPDHRRAAQAVGLRDRPVRQEPPGRPQRVPADRPRVRRVLRQPLPPQRRGGSRGPGLSQRERIPGLQEELRSARRPASVGDGQGRRHRGASLGPCREAARRGHGSADPEAHGDVRRRLRRGRRGLHRAQAQGRTAVLRLGELHPHAPADAHEAREHRPGGALAVELPRHDGRPRQERRDSSSTWSTASASPTTRSSCTAPTTART